MNKKNAEVKPVSPLGKLEKILARIIIRAVTILNSPGEFYKI
jgi:hypothetical protein